MVLLNGIKCKMFGFYLPFKREVTTFKVVFIKWLPI